MLTLSTRNHPCIGCEQSPGGCKHRCNTYREYEKMMHERVYPERMERNNAAMAEASTILYNWHRAMRRAATGRPLKAGYVR